MKFGKRLKRQIEETLPEWRDKFLSYKNLKRLVRRISAAQPSSSAEAEFIHLLDAEIDKLNCFFVEQEEEFVIRQKEFRERIKKVIEDHAAGSRLPEVEYVSEMARIRKEMVDFHGEMVLLVNYSSINYTGLAKILKKYDKRTGTLLRLPFVEKILKQPFFTTDLISKLVKECETTMEAVFPAAAREQQQPFLTTNLISKLVKDCEPATMEAVFPVPAREQPEEQGVGAGSEEEASVAAEQSIFRNTVVALMTMQELRNGSSTYGHFSLPPLNLADSEPFQLPSPISIL